MVITYKDKMYPVYQAEGFSSQYIFPFAKKFCLGRGLDVGCNRIEWSLPGSDPVDPLINPKYDALNLPEGIYDYIFSSHMLEHLYDWVKCLDYWHTKIKDGGCLFLYLPHYNSEYWRPWNNRKHIHVLTAQIIEDYLKDRNWVNIFSSGVDLNCSFAVVAQKNTHKVK